MLFVVWCLVFGVWCLVFGVWGGVKKCRLILLDGIVKKIYYYFTT
jgi:hypothetical protein